jgi:T5SS/PEP-CTERM-associated repeat protein
MGDSIQPENDHCFIVVTLPRPTTELVNTSLFKWSPDVAGFDYKWRLSTGGDATVAANWAFYTNGNPGPTPPGTADEAEFGNLGGTITGTINVYEWVVDPTAGLYTFSANTTATFFEIGTSASLTGTWTQTGAGAVNIESGTFTLGSQAQLISDVTGNTLGLVVDGAVIDNGGAITTDANIGIGVNGAGSVSENSGATLSAAAIELAANTGTSGTLDLSGSSTASFSGLVQIGAGGGSGEIDVNGATLTAQDQMQVGLNSAGTLIVRGGGLVSTSNALSYPFLAVGGAGSTGTVVVQDAGSRLDAGANQVDIGSGGTGTLTVAGGGTFTAGGLFVGSSGTGTVDVTDALTTADISGDAFKVGIGGTGQLTVRQGATLTAAAQLDVGGGGTGTVDITTGATLTSQGAALGVLPSSNVPGNGTVLLDAAQWLSSGQIDVGEGSGGIASLKIADGATLQASATLASTIPFLVVNENVAGHASVDVGGATTRLDAGSNGVIIGTTGFGTLTLHDGARLDAATAGTLATPATHAAFLVGDSAGAVGITTITGTTTEVNVTGPAVIGLGGSGTLSVGGTFAVAGSMFIATDAASNGTVGVSGSGSDVAITGGLVIGGTDQAPGGTGIVTVASGAALTAETLNIHTGSTLSVDTTSTAEIGTANNAITGQLVVDTGITSGGSGTIAAAVTNHGDLVAQSGTLTITGQSTGTGIFDVATGATFDLLQPGSIDIRFDGQTGTAMLGLASGAASITQFSGNDTLHIAGIGTGATATYSGDTATVTGSQGSWSFNFGAPAPSLEVTNQGADALVVACFAAGTLIATPSGEVPVQHLSAGDAVQTQSGKTRRIVWIGTGRVLATRNRRTAATPVIVRKGALTPNVPHHDLRITKGHALHIDGVLIPVEFLVNHRSIEWDDRAQEVTIYHIELETHDVLLANGAPAETYRDDGNRWLFQNANTGWLLPAQEPCAPVLTGGPVLDAIWRRLLDRAGPRPGMTLTDDPDAHLLLGGKRLDPTTSHDGVAIFHLPSAPLSLRLISRAAAPAELGLARDSRMLGVAVRRIALRQGTTFRLIQASDPALNDGFHSFEPDTGLRWTDGDAGLPASLFKGFHGPTELVLHLGCTAQYPLFGDPLRATAA